MKPAAPVTSMRIGDNRPSSTTARAASTPSTRASPMPPRFITAWWFHAKTGRATGAIAFIQRLVVATCQSYVTAVPSGDSKRRNVPVPASSPSARAMIRCGRRTSSTVESNRTAYGIVDRQTWRYTLPSPSPSPWTSSVTLLHAAPPLRPALDRVDHLPDALDRRVDEPGRQERVVSSSRHARSPSRQFGRTGVSGFSERRTE